MTAEETNKTKSAVQASSQSAEKQAEPEADLNRPTFREFLESSPPSLSLEVIAFWTTRNHMHGGGKHFELPLPDIKLHCDDEACGGRRVFRSQGEIRLKKTWEFDFVEYFCSNCEKTSKTFSLATMFDPEVKAIVTAYKFGELPVFGPRVPEKLKKLVGSDREMFFRGRQCESQNLGIGAFAYYRRVVEDRKNKLFDRLIAVISAIEPDNVIIAELETAKAETQFTTAISNIKGAFPQGLLINGENPLTLLYRALSQGIHEHTDEECLAIAKSIRIVLSELIERMDRLVKDDQDLTDALNILRDPSREI